MTLTPQRPTTDWKRSESFKPVILELSLDAMLKDEIVRLTMASDGVSEQEILALREIVPMLARGAK